MLGGGRLKLGPKRKDSGFQRIHKLHQEGQDAENVQVTKISLMEKHQPTGDDLETSKDRAVLQIASPRNLLHQINTTNNIGLRSKVRSNLENLDGPPKQPAHDSKELDEAKLKNNQLQTKIAELEREHKLLLDKTSSSQNEESLQKAAETHAKHTLELQAEIGTLREENDRLRNKVRVLESELQNIDRAYYEKEISRLRTQCENLQIEGLQNKHSSSMLQEQTREFEKQASRKNQEIKALQKQIEKQKVGLIEARNQYNEKERGLRIALEESEAANHLLSCSIEELTKQLHRQEALRKDKATAVDNLQQQIEILLSRAQESDNKSAKLRKSYEEQLAEQTRKMLSFQEQQREKNRQSETLIFRLSSDIERLKMQQNEEQAASKIVGELRQQGQELSKDLRIVRLQEELKEMSLNLQKRDAIVNALEEKLKDYFSPEQYRGLERRCKELEDKRLNSARYYEQKLYNYQKENEQLRMAQIQTVRVEADNRLGFDEIFKKTLDESQELRKEVKRMREELTAAKEQAAQVRQRERGYLNDIEIMRKKVQSSSKNFGIELEVERQKLSNEIDSLRRKLSTTETRLQYKISENKQKDEFIKSVIVGRSSPLQRQSVMAQLERLFLERDKRDLARS